MELLEFLALAQIVFCGVAVIFVIGGILLRDSFNIAFAGILIILAAICMIVQEKSFDLSGLWFFAGVITIAISTLFPDKEKISVSKKADNPQTET